MAAYDITALDSALEFDTSEAVNKSVARLSDTRFVVAWKGASNVGLVQAFDLNRSTGGITALSSALQFEAALDSQPGLTVQVIDSTYFTIFWAENTTDDGFARMFSVNSGTGAITAMGSVLEFDTGDGRQVVTQLIDSTHILATWKQGTAGAMRVFSLNTGTGAITGLDSTQSFATFANSQALQQIDGEHFLVASANADTGNLEARIIEVNTSTWATSVVGGPTTISGSATDPDLCFVSNGGGTALVMSRYLRSSANYTRLLSVNTSTWAVSTSGSEVQIGSVGENAPRNSLWAIDTTHFVVFTRDTGNDGFAKTYSIPTSLIDSIEFDTADNNYNSAADMGEGLYVNAWTGVGEDGFVQAFQVEVPSGPANLKTWNGIAKANIKTINGVPIANVKTIDGVA